MKRIKKEENAAGAAKKNAENSAEERLQSQEEKTVGSLWKCRKEEKNSKMPGSGRKTRKAAACAAAAVLVCGTMSAVAYGAGKGNGTGGSMPSAAAAVEQMFDRAAAQAGAGNPAAGLLAAQAENGAGAGDAALRDETIYVIAKSDGSVSKIIASDWLVKENGESAYQKAEMQGELPVSMRVTFLLDGREIAPEEAAGASGRLTLRFDYENRCVRTAEIGGEEETMYVPFAVMTGVLLDGEKVSNVEITNGRLLSDGDRIMAVGLALPGLSENLRRKESGTADASPDSPLGEDAEEIEIPEYVEIEADVKDFELEATYTLVTNELFHEMDTGKLLDTDQMQSDLDQMEDAMARLINGADELYDGVSTLNEKAGQMTDGINRLYDGSCDLAQGTEQLQGGAGELCEGAGELYDGAGELYAGAKELSGGLSQLQGNSDALTGGARQVFEALLSTASSQLAAAGMDVGTLTADNYSGVLDGVLGSLNAEEVYRQAYEAAKSKVEEAVYAQSDAIRGAVEESVKEAVLAKVLQAVGQQAGVEIPAEQYRELAGRTPEEYQQMIAAGQIPETFPAVIQMITDTAAAQMASGEVQAEIQAAVDQQIQSLIAEKLQSEEVMSQVQAAVESAQAGAGQIAALKSQLDSYQTFYQGILAYTAGVAQCSDGALRLCDGASRLQGGVSSLKDGTGKLAQGTEELLSGASQMQEGIGALKDGGGALTDGVSRLQDGAGKLADGLREFDEEGISKLTKMLREDLQEILDRLDATTELSKQYLPFGQENPEGEDNGTFRFLYKTEAVK